MSNIFEARPHRSRRVGGRDRARRAVYGRRPLCRHRRRGRVESLARGALGIAAHGGVARRRRRRGGVFGDEGGVGRGDNGTAREASDFQQRRGGGGELYVAADYAGDDVRPFVVFAVQAIARFAPFERMIPTSRSVLRSRLMPSVAGPLAFPSPATISSVRWAGFSWM